MNIILTYSGSAGNAVDAYDAESECTEVTMEESLQVENVWDDFASL
jgi:hypothetical protein